MKNSVLLLIASISSISFSYSQVTNYGVGSGTQGGHNSFFGVNAGSLTIEDNNTAVGWNALRYHQTGWSNTAIGSEALYTTYDGIENTAVGHSTLRASSSGIGNTAIGAFAMSEAQSASLNTAVGRYALTYSTGSYNSALGASALQSNNGDYNTAVGYLSLRHNDIGDGNTAHGYYTLTGNKSGYYNSALGYRALQANTSGSNNTAAGAEALYKNTTGFRNTAFGYQSLYENTTGYYNTATGNEAMRLNLSGKFNVATGFFALYTNTSGTYNTANGYRALVNSTGSYNTAQGGLTLDNITTGSYNTAVGYDAGPAVGDLTNTTAIGYQAVPTASNQVRIGNASVTSIGGQVSWSTFSDGRFKKDIKANVAGLEFINQLRPVSYVIEKAELSKFLQVSDSSANASDQRNIPVRQTGFVAQEVDALIKKGRFVFNGVDAPKSESDHYSIRYAEFVVPLVRAVQELTSLVEEQKTRMEQQEEKIEMLTNQLNIKSGTAAAIKHDYATLLQNNPNPFTSDTEIKMIVPDDVRQANLVIYNLEGKQMKAIQINDRGDVAIIIGGSEFVAGMYLYTLIADGNVVDTRRMILTH